MINRINLILRAKNLTARQFAEEIGIQPSGMSHILGGRNNPSLEFVTKVIRRYPEIDANWLLLGRGEMYASGHPIQPSVPQTAPEEAPRATEPTLFANEPEPMQQPDPQLYEDSVPEPQPRVEEYAPSYIAIPPAPVEEQDDDPRLDRILFFYSDNTFRSFRPRR